MLNCCRFRNSRYFNKLNFHESLRREKVEEKVVGCGKLLVVAGLIDSREFIRQGGRNEAGWEQLSLVHGLGQPKTVLVVPTPRVQPDRGPKCRPSPVGLLDRNLRT
jgi:hypothetical protein